MSTRLPPGAKSNRQFTHGTPYGFDKCGCRCDLCRAAYSEYRKAKKAERALRAAAEAPHGTLVGYVNWACRYADCGRIFFAYSNRLNKQQNSESLPAASRRGQDWTGPELEVVLREGENDREKAKILGRTLMSIRVIRHRIKTDARIAAFVSDPPDAGRRAINPR